MRFYVTEVEEWPVLGLRPEDPHVDLEAGIAIDCPHYGPHDLPDELVQRWLTARRELAAASEAIVEHLQGVP